MNGWLSGEWAIERSQREARAGRSTTGLTRAAGSPSGTAVWVILAGRALVRRLHVPVRDLGHPPRRLGRRNACRRGSTSRRGRRDDHRVGTGRDIPGSRRVAGAGTGASVLTQLDRELADSLADFDDPSQWWRRLFSELLGTFFLVLVAAGAGMMGEAFPDTISRTAAAVAPGLMVMAVIMFMGKVSGAHLNPAVSIAFSLRKDFPWRRVPGYVVVQLAGATLACLFLWWVIGVSATYGSTIPPPASRRETRS